jgi:S-adenosylmethionine-dependent methyltransferase
MSSSDSNQPIPQDRIFHGLAERFSQQIYNNPKGQIRLAIVQDDIQQTIPLTPTLRILDMGGGLGQMSLWLAQQGYSVTFVEPADDMFDYATQQFHEAHLTERIQTSHASIQSFSQIQSEKSTNEQYDVILLHAVLEWLADPKHTLEQLLRSLKPNGYLSLLFYNHHSAVMRSLLVADFKRIMQEQIAAVGNHEQGFTPISPLKPETVLTWFNEWGFQQHCWSGVRSFYDYMRPEARQFCHKNAEKLAELIDMEKIYGKQEPWRSLARYQHIIMQSAN